MTEELAIISNKEIPLYEKKEGNIHIKIWKLTKNHLIWYKVEEIINMCRSFNDLPNEVIGTVMNEEILKALRN